MCSLPLRYFSRCLALTTRMLKYFRVSFSFPFLISRVTIMSNLGEFSWSFIFGDCTQLSRERKVRLCQELIGSCLCVFTSKEISRRGSEVTAKKCSKDCDARTRAKLSFCLFNLSVLTFCHCRRLSRCYSVVS